MSGLTPSQTVGPYFAIGLDWPGAECLVRDTTPGTPLVIAGRVLDGDGAPVPDALLEIWQADAAGTYHGTADATFRGAGRTATDAAGSFRFLTVKPGRVYEDGQYHAPHVNLVVFARGLLQQLYTRLYFADEPTANADDAVLACVPAARRATLLAWPDGAVYRFDVHLQGPEETVFFDV